VLKQRSLKRERPWILLIRYGDFFTAGMYIERALQREFNVIPVYLDKTNWMSFLPGSLSTKAIQKLIHLKTRGSVRPDMVLVIDPVWKKLYLRCFDVPTAYYAIDAHIAFNYHVKSAHVQDYDFLFVAQKDYIPKYMEYGCKRVHWLPLACDPDIHKKYDLTQIYDLCFVGCVNPETPRSQLIEKLRKEFKVFVGNRWLHDMAEIYSQSKIVFNSSIKGDVNMRVFEAMSCGRLLLTDRVGNGLEDMFADRKHLVIYNNWSDLIEKICYYLGHPREREKIALCGQQKVHQKHTYAQRINYIADVVFGC